MGWIIATTLDKKHANLNSDLIAAILDRVGGAPQEGSLVILASGDQLAVTESPAELLRSIDSEEHPEDPSASPGNVW